MSRVLNKGSNREIWLYFSWLSKRKELSALWSSCLMYIRFTDFSLVPQPLLVILIVLIQSLSSKGNFDYQQICQLSSWLDFNPHCQEILSWIVWNSIPCSYFSFLLTAKQNNGINKREFVIRNRTNYLNCSKNWGFLHNFTQ